MKFICIAVLMLLVKLSMACSCSPLPKFKTKADLAEYDFIAFVKITGLAPLDEKLPGWGIHVNGEINIEIKELFKGKPVKLITDPGYRSDCAMQVNKGEEWLLFGRMFNDTLIVSKCGYSVRYRDTSGQRDWLGFSGIRELNALIQIYAHPVPISHVKRTLYPNGKTEIEQSFTNNILSGTRKIYYPDGKIYIAEDFKNGNRVGARKFYGKSGQLLILTLYDAAGLKREEIHYQDTTENAWYLNYQIHHNKDPLFGEIKHDSTFFIKALDSLRLLKDWDKQISLKETYTNGGRNSDMISYDYMGRIRSDNHLDWDKQVIERHLYYPNGKVQNYSNYNQKRNLAVEIDHAENGTIRTFSDVCRSCKFYFDINSPLQGKPEEIYVQ